MHYAPGAEYTDVFFFFKFSAARREDYSLMETFTDLEARIALRRNIWVTFLAQSSFENIGAISKFEAVFLGVSPFAKELQERCFPH